MSSWCKIQIPKLMGKKITFYKVNLHRSNCSQIIWKKKKYLYQLKIAYWVGSCKCIFLPELWRKFRKLFFCVFVCTNWWSFGRFKLLTHVPKVNCVPSVTKRKAGYNHSSWKTVNCKKLQKRSSVIRIALGEGNTVQFWLYHIKASHNHWAIEQ